MNLTQIWFEKIRFHEVCAVHAVSNQIWVTQEQKDQIWAAFVGCVNRDKQPLTVTSTDSLESPINLTSMLMNCGMQRETQSNCPGESNSLLWGDSVNHHSVCDFFVDDFGRNYVKCTGYVTHGPKLNYLRRWSQLSFTTLEWKGFIHTFKRL